MKNYIGLFTLPSIIMILSLFSVIFHVYNFKSSQKVAVHATKAPIYLFVNRHFRYQTFIERKCDPICLGPIRIKEKN